MKNLLIITISCTIAVTILCGTAGLAAVIYSEDWEALSAGFDIGNTAGNPGYWDSQGSYYPGPIALNQRRLDVGSGLHLGWSKGLWGEYSMGYDANGDVHTFGTINDFKKTIGSKTSGQYTMTAKVWPYTYGRDSSQLADRSFIGLSSTYTPVAYWYFDNDPAPGPGQCGMIFKYAAGQSPRIIISADADTLLTINVNLTNRTAWGSIKQGTNTWNTSVFNITAGTTFDSVIIRQYKYSRYPFDIDDIQVEAVLHPEIPERSRNIFFYGTYGVGSKYVGGWEGAFDELARAHMNIGCQIQPDTVSETNQFRPEYYPEIEDAARKRGVYLVGQPSGNSPQIVEMWKTLGSAYVESYVDSLLSATGSSPNLIAWYIRDEPLLGTDPSAVQGVKQIFAQKDPQRMGLFILNGTYLLSSYESFSTVVWTDSYPLVISIGRNPWTIKDWCKTVSQSTTKRQWFAPQAFGFTDWWTWNLANDYYCPTTEEFRLMLYLALANGSKAFTMFGYQGWEQWVTMADRVGNLTHVGTETSRIGEKWLPIGPLLLDATPVFDPVVAVSTTPGTSHIISIGSMGDLTAGPIFMVATNEDIVIQQSGQATLPPAWVSSNRLVYDLFSLTAVSSGGASTFTVAPLDPGDGRIYMLGTAEQYAAARDQIMTNQVEEILRVQGADRLIAERWGLSLSTYDALVQQVRTLLNSDQYDQAINLANGQAAQTLADLIAGDAELSNCRSQLLEAKQSLGSASLGIYSGAGIVRSGQEANAPQYESLALQYGQLRRKYLLGQKTGLLAQVSAFNADVQDLLAMVLTPPQPASFPWSENFDSGTLGQSVTSPPISWAAISPSGAKLSISSGLHPTWTSLAIDGSSGHLAGSVDPIEGKAVYFRQVDGIPTTGVISLTFKAWATSGKTIGNFGFSRGGEQLGAYLSFNPNPGRGWEFDTRSLGGDYYYFNSTIGKDQTVLARIVMDYVNNKAWAELCDANGILLEKTPAKSAIVNTTCYGVVLEELTYASGYPDGLDIDDVSIGSGIAPGVISGQIELGDYSGDLSLCPVRIELKQNGAAVRTEEIKLSANPEQYALSNVTAGTYDVVFSACGWLKRTSLAVQVPGGGTGVANAKLLNGDVDGDNSITGADLNVLLQNLDQMGGRQ